MSIQGLLHLLLVNWVPVQDIIANLFGDCRVAEKDIDATQVVLRVCLKVEFQCLFQGIAQSIIEVGFNQPGALEHAPGERPFKRLGIMLDDIGGYINDDGGGYGKSGGERFWNSHTFIPYFSVSKNDTYC